MDIYHLSMIRVIHTSLYNYTVKDMASDRGVILKFRHDIVLLAENGKVALSMNISGKIILYLSRNNTYSEKSRVSS